MKLKQLLNVIFQDSEIKILHWDLIDDSTKEDNLEFIMIEKLSSSVVNGFEKVLNSRVVDVSADNSKLSILVTEVEVDELRRFINAVKDEQSLDTSKASIQIDEETVKAQL